MSESAPATPSAIGLVPGWLERLAAVGWRLLAAILLGVVLFSIAARARDRHGSILIAAIVAATFAPFVLALRRSWLVADQGSRRGLPRRGGRHHRDARRHRHRVHPVHRRGRRRPSVMASPPLKQQLASRRTSRRRSASPSTAPRRASQAWVSAQPVVGLRRTSARSRRSPILATFLTFFFLMDGDKAWVWALSSANTWRREAIDDERSRRPRAGRRLPPRDRRDRRLRWALAEGLPGHPRGAATPRRWPSSSSSAGSSRMSGGWSRRS